MPERPRRDTPVVDEGRHDLYVTGRSPRGGRRRCGSSDSRVVTLIVAGPVAASERAWSNAASARRPAAVATIARRAPCPCEGPSTAPTGPLPASCRRPPTRARSRRHGPAGRCRNRGSGPRRAEAAPIRPQADPRRYAESSQWTGHAGTRPNDQVLCPRGVTTSQRFLQGQAARPPAHRRGYRCVRTPSTGPPRIARPPRAAPARTAYPRRARYRSPSCRHAPRRSRERRPARARSPNPPAAASPRKNFVNTCACWSTGMPSPSS